MTSYVEFDYDKAEIEVVRGRLHLKQEARWELGSIETFIPRNDTFSLFPDGDKVVLVFQGGYVRLVCPGTHGIPHIFKAWLLGQKETL